MELIKQWTNCYKTCRTCYNFGNEFEHNCSSCIYNHHFIFGTNNIDHSNDLVKNEKIDQASKGYTFTSTVGVTPYDVDKGLAETAGRYVTPITTVQNAVA